MKKPCSCYLAIYQCRTGKLQSPGILQQALCILLSESKALCSARDREGGANVYVHRLMLRKCSNATRARENTATLHQCFTETGVVVQLDKLAMSPFSLSAVLISQGSL